MSELINEFKKLKAEQQDDSCSKKEPFIKLGKGVAPLLNYNIPQSACFSTYGHHFVKGISQDMFLPATKKKPAGNYFEITATKRPSKLNSWNEWRALAPNQRRTIASLGGFKEDTTTVKENDTDLEKLKKAYKSWPSDLYSVFWQNKSYSGVWTCNIFVGDAIYLWKKKSVTNENRHYFGPADIKAGKTN